MVKVLLTVLVVYAVWFYFKNQRRIKAAYEEAQEKRARDAGRSSVPVAQDLIPCAKCGAYVAANQPHTCDTPPTA